MRDGRQSADEMRACDPHDATFMLNEYGKVLVIAGRNEEALAVLSEIMPGLSDIVPRSYGYYPILGRLKGNKRSLGIIGSAKSI